MREKGWNIVGRVKNPVPPLAPGRIGAGSRVTFVDRFGKNRTGTAVMKGPHGWVLNMGGRHGTPHVVKPETIVKVVNPRRKANPEWVQSGGVHIDIGTDNKGKTRVNPSPRLRKIAEIADGSRVVKTYWNAEYSEYVVRVFTGGKENKAASYHTNDKDDAIATARAMLDSPTGMSRRAALMRRSSNPVHKVTTADDPREVLAAMKLEYRVLKQKVSSKIPVSGIERMVDARPVSTTFREIEKIITNGTAGPGWTDKMVKEAVAVAIARHRVRQAADEASY